MEIEEVIKKSIEGGWVCKETVSGIKLTKGNVEAQMIVAGSFYKSWLLDPAFWSCLSKSMGWEAYCTTGKFDACYPECSIEEEIETWLYYWHKFIDSLAEGKSIADFFKNL